jgi:PhnB protein
MSESTPYIPEGFHSVTPYLVGSGTARLMEFLAKAFGAEETFRMARPDGTIGHASMKLADSALEMADPMEASRTMQAALHLYVPNADEVYHRSLAAGAASLYEPEDMPYGDRVGGIKDPAGNDWYIATRKGGAHFAPQRFHAVTPSLSVAGAHKLLAFLEKAFAANVVGKHEAANGTIDHATIQIGDSVIEASEAHGQWGPRTATLHVYVADTDRVYAQALAAGATSLQEPKDQFYGERNSGVMDAWGNHWYIATHREALSEAEVRSRAAEQGRAAG